MSPVPPVNEPSPEPAPDGKTPGGGVLKNILYFGGSMLAAYVIVQTAKLGVIPWLLERGLWPFGGG